MISRLLDRDLSDITEKVYARFLPATLSSELNRLNASLQNFNLHTKEAAKPLVDSYIIRNFANRSNISDNDQNLIIRNTTKADNILNFRVVAQGFGQPSDATRKFLFYYERVQTFNNRSYARPKDNSIKVSNLSLDDCMTFDKAKLNDLIKEGEKFHIQTVPAHLEPGGYGMVAKIPTMHYLDDAEKFAIWRQKCIRFLTQYFPKDIALVEFRDLDWEKKLTPAKLYDLIGALKALKDNPIICEVKDLPNSQNSITINQNQTQNQTQTFNVILNSLKDELRGKEYDEIEKILSSNSSKEEKKKSIIEKLKSFGENVASGVVASILTNGF